MRRSPRRQRRPRLGWLEAMATKKPRQEPAPTDPKTGTLAALLEVRDHAALGELSGPSERWRNVMTVANRGSNSRDPKPSIS